MTVDPRTVIVDPKELVIADPYRFSDWAVAVFPLIVLLRTSSEPC